MEAKRVAKIEGSNSHWAALYCGSAVRARWLNMRSPLVVLGHRLEGCPRRMVNFTAPIHQAEPQASKPS